MRLPCVSIRIGTCRQLRYAYKSPVSHGSGRRLNGRFSISVEEGRKSGCRCLCSFGSLGLSARALRRAGFKRGFAPRRATERKGSSVPLYEHVFLARQDISQAQVDALTKEYGDVISEGGGRIGKVEYWGVKPLAFKIK